MLVLSVVCAGVVALVLILSSLAILAPFTDTVTRVSLYVAINVTLDVVDAVVFAVASRPDVCRTPNQALVVPYRCLSQPRWLYTDAWFVVLLERSDDHNSLILRRQNLLATPRIIPAGILF